MHLYNTKRWDLSWTFSSKDQILATIFPLSERFLHKSTICFGYWLVPYVGISNPSGFIDMFIRSCILKHFSNSTLIEIGVTIFLSLFLFWWIFYNSNRLGGTINLIFLRVECFQNKNMFHTSAINFIYEYVLLRPHEIGQKPKSQPTRF